jgi:hypothetical protein
MMTGTGARTAGIERPQTRTPFSWTATPRCIHQTAMRDCTRCAGPRTASDN